MFKYYILYCTFLCAPILLLSQGRILLNDDPYIVFNNGTAVRPAFVIVDNPNANAITEAGTGGNILSENEYNKIRWRVAGSTGNYVVPFTTSNLVKIPYSMNITGGGTGGTHIDFSTYPTNQENVVYPSMVTNLEDLGTSDPDFSYWMVDRFWMIDAMNYTNRPASTMTFGYDLNEFPAPNMVVAGNLSASRYNSNTDVWSGTLLNWGTDNIGFTQVENAIIPASELFEAWTLIDAITPLPVELVYIQTECLETYVEISWATASETNSSHFIVEKSIDGFAWNTIAQVQAQGNSSSYTEYSYRDYNPEQATAYYRLSQVDYDGAETVYAIQSVQACGEGADKVWLYNQFNGQFQLSITSAQKQQVEMHMFDMNGKIVIDAKKLNISAGENKFLFDQQHLATGVYMIYLQGATINTNHKLIIQK